MYIIVSEALKRWMSGVVYISKAIISALLLKLMKDIRVGNTVWIVHFVPWNDASLTYRVAFASNLSAVMH